MLGLRWSLLVLVVSALCADATASPNNTVALGGHVPGWAAAKNDRGHVADQRIGHLTVQLARSPEQQRALDQLVAAQQTLGSPLYHQWLTPTQIGERFGASDADVASVTAWAHAQGFTVLKIARSRSFVELAGTTRIAERAFGVEFHSYAVGARTEISIDREPSVPAVIAHAIAHISGLHTNRPQPQHVMAGIHSNVVDSMGNHWVGVNDFATVYDLGALRSASIDGSGQAIGIIGRARVLAADITNYGTVNNVTMPTAQVVIPSTGVDPGAACGTSSCKGTAEFDDQEEATLDVTRAGSVAPGAKLELIVSTTDSMGDDGTQIALEYAIDEYKASSDASILNVSFGSCEAEDSSGQADATQLDQAFQTATAAGQSIFISAGDSGAADCQPQGEQQDTSDPTTASVNIFCASGYVTCMGGTKFADAADQSTYWDGSGNATGYIPEGAWNEADLGDGTYRQLGGGGGASMYVAKPSFQTSTASTMRMVPDASFDAAEGEGYVLCLAALGADCASDTSFAYTVVGGTSAAAPDMAGVAALIAQTVGSPQGNVNTNLYMLGTTTPAAFHDVTVASSGVTNCSVSTPSLCNNSDPGKTGLTGGTAGFEVGTGYDEATGLGSLDISKLVANWPGAQLPMLTIDPTSLTVLAGKSGTVTLDATGFASAPTFSCGNGLPAAATCAFSGTTLTITVGGASAAVTDGSSRNRWLLIIPCALALLLRRRRRQILVLTFTFAFASCSGSVGSATVDAAPPVTTSVTITATSGSQSASAMLSLTIN